MSIRDKAALLLPPVRKTAENTPPERDRVIDAVRAFALFIVVFGHLLMAVVYWPDEGAPIVGNLMANYAGLQYLTWLLQVMPIFFAFGGAASVIAWRKADAGNVLYSAWMWGRVRRLLRPVLVYFAIMAVASMIISQIVGPDARSLLGIIAQPLWFLGIYILTLLFLPALWWVHQRNKAITFIVLIPAAAAVSIGVTIFGWPPALGFLNFLFCWLAIQQLGFFWGEHTKIRTWVTVAVTSLTVNIALVYYGPWPMSLVGLPGDVLSFDQITLFGQTWNVPGWNGEYSNMSPPSLILLLHGLTLVSLIFIARKPLQRLLQRPKVWLATSFMMLTAMSLYIWHLLAIILALATLHAFGASPPTRLAANGWPEPTGTAAYASWWLLFLAVFLIYLSILVLLTWSTEYRPLPWWDKPSQRGILPVTAPGWLYVTGVIISGIFIVFGTLIVALVGFNGFPFNNAEWGGLTLNSGIALVVLLAGSAFLRSLARQPLEKSQQKS